MYDSLYLVELNQEQNFKNRKAKCLAWILDSRFASYLYFSLVGSSADIHFFNLIEMVQ